MKKIITKRIFRIISVFLIVSLAIAFFTPYCKQPREFEQKVVNSFYNEPVDSLDYVVIGASALQCGILPAKLYKDFGITGYDMCLDAANYRITNSMLKEIIKNQPNAIIVVDMDMFNFIKDNVEYDAEGTWLEVMPRNNNWAQTIIKADRKNKQESWLTLLKYHYNMPDVPGRIFIGYRNSRNKNIDNMHGSRILKDTRLNDDEYDQLTLCNNDEESILSIDIKTEKILIEFLDNCKHFGIKNVLFIDSPKAYFDKKSYEEKIQFEQKSNYCEKIIKGFGYDVLNFNKDPQKYKFEKTDFADSFHLKKSGAEKLSNFVGKYLTQNYQFKEKSEIIRNAWNKSTIKAYDEYDI